MEGTTLSNLEGNNLVERPVVAAGTSYAGERPKGSRRADKTRPALPWARPSAWLQEHGLSGLTLLLLVVVAGAGWKASFIGLHVFAMEHMNFEDGPAWLVPITIDGAACGMTLMVFRAAMHGRPAPGYRFLVACFTGLSSWINWFHIADSVGGRVAAVLCPSSVVLLEALTKEIRLSWEERNGLTPRLTIHPMRWVLAPWTTFKIMRTWILELPVPTHQTATSDQQSSARTLEPTHSRTAVGQTDRDYPLRPEARTLESGSSGRAFESEASDSATYESDRASSERSDPRSMPAPGERFTGRGDTFDGREPSPVTDEAMSAPEWPIGEEDKWNRIAEELGEDPRVLADAVDFFNKTIDVTPKAPGRDKIRDALTERGHAVGSKRALAIKEALHREQIEKMPQFATSDDEIARTGETTGSEPRAGREDRADVPDEASATSPLARSFDDAAA